MNQMSMSSVSSSEDQTQMMNFQKSVSDGSSLASQGANSDFTNLVHVGSYYDQKGCQGSALRSQQHTKTSIDVLDSEPNLPADVATNSKMTFSVRYAVDVEGGGRDTESQQSMGAERQDLDWEEIHKKLAEYPSSSEMHEIHNFSSSEHNHYLSRPGDEFDLESFRRDGHYWGANSSGVEISEANELYRTQFSGSYSIPGTTTHSDHVQENGILYNDWDINEGYFDTGNNVSNRSLSDAKQLVGHCRNSEADYLFSEELVKKRKFRLMINPVMERKLKAEFPRYSNDLESMIKQKYWSLGIPVEVKAYRRQDKNVDKTTSTKAFNLIFDSYRDVKAAMELTDSQQLDFTMKEARPSPNYLVKYMVMYSILVFEGKCFSKQIGDLQLYKGDIVTANQLKGNKLRIIRYRPAGTEYERDISGWVLLQTKEKELLRRVNYIDGEIVMIENRPNFETLIPKEHQTVEAQKAVHKTNPQRVSAARCSPFKVLSEVEVCKGRKEPTVVGKLKPNQIVWANQHKGSMLRIVKTEHGDIKLDHEFKPQIWGWVSLRRKGEEPRLERMTHGAPYKTKKGKLERRKGNPAIHRSRSFHSDMSSSFSSPRGYDHSFPLLPRRGINNREPHSPLNRTTEAGKRERLALKQTFLMGSPRSVDAMSVS